MDEEQVDRILGSYVGDHEKPSIARIDMTLIEIQRHIKVIRNGVGWIFLMMLIITIAIVRYVSVH